ncbi:MAG TPA: STAS/SEC14 domain-containing protein [Herpetosiphon sp.]|nr:STAS/SEC14 domain-containing protein [Herpetosiphon sp.]
MVLIPHSYTTRSSIITLEGDGIIVIKIRPGIQETVEDAEENLAAVDMLANGIRRPRLLDLREALPISREVRRFYMQPATRNSATIVALLVDSTLSRVIANLIIGLTGNSQAVQVFSDEQAARQWLRQANAN